MNRTRYDQCYLSQQTRQSTMPIDMIMMPFRNQVAQPCRDDSAIGPRGAPWASYPKVIDVESDLHGLSVTKGKCNSRGNQYVPSCLCAPSAPCQCGGRRAAPNVTRSCPMTSVYPATLVRQ